MMWKHEAVGGGGKEAATTSWQMRYWIEENQQKDENMLNFQLKAKYEKLKWQ